MAYRDDDAAAKNYHDDLVRELSALEAKLAALGEVAADRDRVVKELARMRADLADRAARPGPLRLAQVRVASPCKESWDDMIGDERVRACRRCDRPVFNLSAMTSDEAEALLATKGATPCVRFYRRPDGTIMTADCPDQAKRRRVALAFAAGAVASAAAVAGAAAALVGGDAPKTITVKTELIPPLPPPTMGAPPPMPTMGEAMPPDMGKPEPPKPHMGKPKHVMGRMRRPDPPPPPPEVEMGDVEISE